MIDLSDGLAERPDAALQGLGLRRAHLPRTHSRSPGRLRRCAEEMHADPVVAALNGGEDYELLFTVPLSMQEQVMRLGLVDVIGHITPASDGLLTSSRPTGRRSH